MSAPPKYVSYVNLPVPPAAVQSALDAAKLKLDVSPYAIPPLIELQICGQRANVDSDLVLHAWFAVLGTLPPSAFDIEILPEFSLRGKDQDTVAVRCKLTHLLETSIVGARIEAHRRVASLVPSFTAFEPWILLCEGGALPNHKDLPPSFGKFRADTLRVSCPAKRLDGTPVSHMVLGEAELPAEEEEEEEEEEERVE